MYSPKLFFYFNGSETDWVDFLTIIYPAKKNLDKHTRATVRSDCTWFPQLSATTKGVDAIDQSNLCFWSVSEGGQFVIQMKKEDWPAAERQNITTCYGCQVDWRVL